MPEETKGPEPVSPSPGGAAEAAQEAPPAKPEPSTAQAQTGPATPPAAAANATESKPPDVAQPAAPPAAAKPSAPAAKPAAAAAAKPAAPAKPAGPQPEPWNSDLVAKLKKQYGSGIREACTYVGQKYLVVDSGIVYEVLRHMRDDEQYDYCVDITAVHWPKREQPFDVIYILYSFPYNERVRIKTQIAEGQHLQSAVNLWPTTNWLEREVFDMFGIVFDGHPDLKRILLPDGWKGHPLRKDYDILLQDKEWVQINLGIESGQ
jgi:NADH-quinone oxidoreductase subunit C